jgi:hypothetical protein
MGYGPGMEVPFYPRVRGFGNAAPTAQAIPDRAPAFPPAGGSNRTQTEPKRQGTARRPATQAASPWRPGYDDGA